MSRSTVVRGSLSLTAGGTEGEFVYQAIAGAAFPLTQWGVPVLSLTAEYRFFGTLEPSFNTRLFNTATGAELGGTKLRSQNLNHSILLGLGYALLQPPPPVAPVAPAALAPQVVRTYLVFFDWDCADLTARAREIIGEAAQNARRVQITRIEVAGHADRSGSAQYNQRLSQRCADAVAADLVRNGISRNGKPWRPPLGRRVARLLMAGPRTLSRPCRVFAVRSLEKVPALATTIAVAKRLENVLRRRSGEKLEDVLGIAEATQLMGCVTELRKGLSAVEAALTLPWTISPAEGQIGRIKMLKRTMCGRAGFERLRARVLHAA